jgi:hypothetical protein
MSWLKRHDLQRSSSCDTGAEGLNFFRTDDGSRRSDGALRRGVKRQRPYRTSAELRGDKFFDSLHIFLASKVNIRILHDANSLQVCAD